LERVFDVKVAGVGRWWQVGWVSQFYSAVALNVWLAAEESRVCRKSL
jgi:hypothetical protein